MTDIEVVNLKTQLGTAFEIAISRHDTDAVTQSVRTGSSSLPVSVEMLLAGIPRKATVVDLGAHIGTFAIAAAAFGYNVIAVEASPRNVELLQASVHLNNFNNLRVVPAAIADRVGTTYFFENGPYGVVNTSRFAPPGSFQIVTTTVDELISQLPIEAKISFVKMDSRVQSLQRCRGCRNYSPRMRHRRFSMSQTDTPYICLIRHQRC